MSRLILTSELHLGQVGVSGFRQNFSSDEEHDEVIFDNLATFLNKRDTIILLGDITFNKEWLARIDALNVIKKILVPGNHCTDRKVHMRDLVQVYDDIHALHSRRNYWFSHCPIHESEMRSKIANVHGHAHKRHIDSAKYLNICVENTDWKPITFKEMEERLQAKREIYGEA